MLQPTRSLSPKRNCGATQVRDFEESTSRAKRQ
jgi:hypothetical protein